MYLPQALDARDIAEVVCVRLGPQRTRLRHRFYGHGALGPGLRFQ